MKSKSKRTFFYYIPKILKNISEEKSSISKDAKNKLNCLLLLFTKIIIKQSINLLNITFKTTLNIKTIVNSLRIIFVGELLNNILLEGNKYIEQTHNTSELIIPPSFFKPIIKELIPLNIKISKKYPTFLSAIIEYISAEILDLALLQALKHEHVRITSLDIDNSLLCDDEFKYILTKYSLHLFNIDEKLNLSQTGFNRIIRIICKTIEGNDVKISKNTLQFLQVYMEKYVKNILLKSHNLSLYNGRTKITKSDIDLILTIQKSPPFTSSLSS